MSVNTLAFSFPSLKSEVRVIFELSPTYQGYKHPSEGHLFCSSPPIGSEVHSPVLESGLALELAWPIRWDTFNIFSRNSLSQIHVFVNCPYCPPHDHRQHFHKSSYHYIIWVSFSPTSKTNFLVVLASFTDSLLEAPPAPTRLQPPGQGCVSTFCRNSTILQCSIYFNYLLLWNKPSQEFNGWKQQHFFSSLKLGVWFNWVVLLLTDISGRSLIGLEMPTCPLP